MGKRCSNMSNLVPFEFIQCLIYQWLRENVSTRRIGRVQPSTEVNARADQPTNQQLSERWFTARLALPAVYQYICSNNKRSLVVEWLVTNADPTTHSPLTSWFVSENPLPLSTATRELDQFCYFKVKNVIVMVWATKTFNPRAFTQVIQEQS